MRSGGGVRRRALRLRSIERSLALPSLLAPEFAVNVEPEVVEAGQYFSYSLEPVWIHLRYHNPLFFSRIADLDSEGVDDHASSCEYSAGLAGYGDEKGFLERPRPDQHVQVV